jgi:hypothetical protein
MYSPLMLFSLGVPRSPFEAPGTVYQGCYFSKCDNCCFCIPCKYVRVPDVPEPLPVATKEPLPVATAEFASELPVATAESVG